MRRINAKTFARLEELQGYAQELADLLYDIHDNAEEYHSERSERWLESDAGAAYEAWVDLLDTARDAAQVLADQAGAIPQGPND